MMKDHKSSHDKNNMAYRTAYYLITKDTVIYSFFFAVLKLGCAKIPVHRYTAVFLWRGTYHGTAACTAVF